MVEMTKKEIRTLIKDGVAKDYTAYNARSFREVLPYICIVGISYGVYGVSAILFRDERNNTMGAITQRTTALFLAL